MGEPKPVPSNLSFTNNYEETVEFLSGISDSLRSAPSIPRKYRRINKSKPPTFANYWDFSTINEISTTVALVIASEYDRLRRLNSWRPSAVNIDSWRGHVRSLLKAIGFLELCGVDRYNGNVSEIDGFIYRKLMACEDAVGEELGDFFDDVGIKLDDLHPQIYDGLFEALLNTRHHAYMGPGFNEDERCWWMFGAYSASTRELILTVYDHGISIPKSLLSGGSDWGLLQPFLDTFRRAFGWDPDGETSAHDGDVLHMAMTLGKSRTQKEYRGKGLPAIDHVIEVCDEGSVAIRSRRGQYVRRKGGEPSLSTHVHPLRGTLIVWQVTLPEVA